MSYGLGPDSSIQPGVPQGIVTDHSILDSKIFPGTKRMFSIYVPRQYDPATPAALMVFNDGHAYQDPERQYRATVVMDNLIARGELPVIIGVFVDPGRKMGQLPEKRGWQPTPKNRSFEYDSITGDYAQFLVEEVLPLVEAKYNITPDPSGRAICGASSGGIAAFNAAWHRPDQFSKVLSHIGSFTNIRHGDQLPGIIRKTEKKPLRVYLQDGANDLDNIHGNWPLGNIQMARSLAFMDYDYRFDFGSGTHSGEHGGAVLPDAMRWLWRDYPGVQSLPPSLQAQDRDVAWLKQRFDAKLLEKTKTPRVDILMVGDSITHSWETNGQAKRIWKKQFGNFSTLNVGYSGDRTEHTLWRLRNGQIEGVTAKVIPVMIGTNNLIRDDETAEQTAAGVQEIIRELRHRQPDARILLMAIFPRAATPEDGPRVRNDKVNAILETYADGEHVFWLDLKDQFLESDGTLSREIMPDLLHPNGKGYQIWADAMQPEIERLLKM